MTLVIHLKSTNSGGLEPEVLCDLLDDVLEGQLTDEQIVVFWYRQISHRSTVLGRYRSQSTANGYCLKYLVFCRYFRYWTIFIIKTNHHIHCYRMALVTHLKGTNSGALEPEFILKSYGISLTRH